jgi:hypothetical protein
MTSLTVDFCCNDGRNGAFQGWFDAIEVTAETGDILTMNSLPIGLPEECPAITFEPDRICVNGTHYPKRGHGQGSGNWCWDSVLMQASDVLNLLRQLHALGFCLDEWDTDFPGLEDVIKEIHP